jgi:type I restriction enzyme S subunit
MKKGWEYKKLGEVCKIIGGGTPNKKNASYYNGDIKWATVRDMNVDYLETTEFTITKDGLEKSSSNVIPAGEIIIATRVGLGKVCLLKSDTAINQDLKGVVPIKNDSINRKFLFYWFKSISDYIVKNGVGATVQGVKLTFVNNINFPVPPLSEQKEIVDYLDSSFAKIDKLKENAAKNLEEAKALFQSALKNALEPKEGWEEKTLKELSEIQSGYAFKSSDFKSSGKYQVIRMGNVRPGVIRYNESPVFINEELDEKAKEKALLQIGDMIITQTGSRNKRDYGFTVLIEKDNLLLNQRIARIRVKDKLLNKYLLYYSWTDYFRDQYFANEGGTVGQGNVGMDAIKDNIIPLPSLSEQQSIVSFLDSLSEKLNTLQQNYSRICNECDALKQAILRQVFE